MFNLFKPPALPADDTGVDVAAKLRRSAAGDIRGSICRSVFDPPRTIQPSIQPSQGCDNQTPYSIPFKEVIPVRIHTIVRIILVSASLLACAASQAQNAVTEAAAKESGAVVSATGLVYRSLKDGTGASPTASDKVKVHYRGTFPDGKEFDSSYKRSEAIEFPLSGVIKCWTEGVQRMKVGGKAKLTCPASIAYGERGAGGVIPPNATLLFEVELLAINGK